MYLNVNEKNKYENTTLAAIILQTAIHTQRQQT